MFVVLAVKPQNHVKYIAISSNEHDTMNFVWSRPVMENIRPVPLPPLTMSKCHPRQSTQKWSTQYKNTIKKNTKQKYATCFFSTQ